MTPNTSYNDTYYKIIHFLNLLTTYNNNDVIDFKFTPINTTPNGLITRRRALKTSNLMAVIFRKL